MSLFLYRLRHTIIDFKGDKMVDCEDILLFNNYYKSTSMPAQIDPQNEQPIIKERPALPSTVIVNMLWSFGLSLFWIVFIWRFWDKGPFALGINASIFFIFFLAMFIRPLYYSRHYGKRDLYWLIPLLLIAFSFLLYENPFIKMVNVFVYPLLIFLFVNYGFLKDKEKRYWGINFIANFFSRFFSLFGQIGMALKHYIELFSPKRGKGTARQIILGLVLMLAVAFVVVIPLLSSADPVFGDKLAFVYDLVRRYISESVMAKIVFFLVFTPLLFSSFLAWAREFDYEDKEKGIQVDSIVAGIVLGGILILYLLFLWIQLERLWVGSLPFEFRETETLVKSGFWQLFFLTGLNILLYFFTYRKTSAPVQKILTAFTTTSLLLLASAGQRVALYVVDYGFSYEKFFAAYTVIYCAILFVWMLFCLFKKERANIFKFLVFLFLWMYAIVTVLPVEQFILRSNVALAKRPESRIRLFELTMLSPDVLDLVKKYRSEGVFKEDWRPYEGVFKEDWRPWIDEQEKRLAEKRWYEFNF